MKAYFLVLNSSPDDSFEIREVPEPVLSAGEVKIKVSAFGLNYADVLARQGLYRECPPLPCVIGYDVEGIIVDVAADVSDFKIGDRVFALTRFGGYAEFVCTKAVAVNHLPAEAPDGAGCALATQYVTAYHAAIHTQTLMPGEKVLIHAAAGGLGTALIQIARWKQCAVIGIVGGDEKVEYINSIGATHAIDHQKIEWTDYINNHFNGKVDVVFDTVGGSAVKKAKAVLAKGGRLVSLGAASLSGKKGIFNLLRLAIGFGFFSPISYLSKSQSLIGVNMLKIADHRPDIIAHCFRNVASLYAEGILKPHIGKIYSQDELPAAHQWMEDRNSIGKIVVKWD